MKTYTRPPQLSWLQWNVALPKKKKNTLGSPLKSSQKKKEGKPFFLLLRLNLRTQRGNILPWNRFSVLLITETSPKLTKMGSRRKTGHICPIYAIQIPVSNKKGKKTASMWPLCPQFVPSVSQWSICPRESLVYKLRVTSKACFSSSKSCFPGAYLRCEELPTTTITRPPWVWALYEVHRFHTPSFQHKGSTSTSHKSVCNSL